MFVQEIGVCSYHVLVLTESKTRSKVRTGLDFEFEEYCANFSTVAFQKMKLAAIVVVFSLSIFFSCDDESSKLDQQAFNRRGHTVSLVRNNGIQSEYRYAEIHFSYEDDVLTGTKSLQFSRQFLTDPFVVESTDLKGYKYVNGRLEQITNSNYPNYIVSITYNTDGSVKANWVGQGRSNGYNTYKYAPNGKLDSVITDWKVATESSKSKSKVNWNGDNVESLVTRGECMCGGVTTPILTYDTVTYRYGDGFNPFFSPKYAGYAESLGAKEKIPFASKNILSELDRVSENFIYGPDHVLLQHQRANEHHVLTYVLDNENYPVEIREEVTSSNESPYVIKSEIKY